MTENSRSRFDTESLFNICSKLRRAVLMLLITYTLGNNDYKVLFAGLLGVEDPLNNILFNLELHLGYKDSRRADSNTRLLSQAQA